MGSTRRSTIAALLGAAGALGACSVVERIVPAPGVKEGDGGATAASSSASSASSSASVTASSGGGGASASSTGAGGSTSASGGGGAGGGPGGGGAGAGGGSVSASTSSVASGGGQGGAPATCDTTLQSFPLEPAAHVAACTPVDYASNPPTSGPHYPSWAAFKVYDTAVPWGFLVHAMEHGAVVVSYNCAVDCSPEVAALVAHLGSMPVDPMCIPPLERRIIVTPEPSLDVKFAVSAWGWALRSQCFDLAGLDLFVAQHYAKAPENFCFDGVDVASPDAGIPADCGL